MRPTKDETSEKGKRVDVGRRRIVTSSDQVLRVLLI